MSVSEKDIEIVTKALDHMEKIRVKASKALDEAGETWAEDEKMDEMQSFIGGVIPTLTILEHYTLLEILSNKKRYDGVWEQILDDRFPPGLDGCEEAHNLTSCIMALLGDYKPMLAALIGEGSFEKECLRIREEVLRNEQLAVLRLREEVPRNEQLAVLRIREEVLRNEQLEVLRIKEEVLRNDVLRNERLIDEYIEHLEAAHYPQAEKKKKLAVARKAKGCLDKCHVYDDMIPTLVVLAKAAGDIEKVLCIVSKKLSLERALGLEGKTSVWGADDLVAQLNERLEKMVNLVPSLNHEELAILLDFLGAGDEKQRHYYDMMSKILGDGLEGYNFTTCMALLGRHLGKLEEQKERGVLAVAEQDRLAELAELADLEEKLKQKKQDKQAQLEQKEQIISAYTEQQKGHDYKPSDEEEEKAAEIKAAEIEAAEIKAELKNLEEVENTVKSGRGVNYLKVVTLGSMKKSLEDFKNTISSNRETLTKDLNPAGLTIIGRLFNRLFNRLKETFTQQPEQSLLHTGGYFSAKSHGRALVDAVNESSAVVHRH